MDSFSRSHLAAFPGAALLSEDSLACLNAVVHTSSAETVGVEWGHGRVHRLITQSSVQTHTPNAEFVGAQWLCQKVQQRKQQNWRATQEAQQKKNDTRPAGQEMEVKEIAKKRRGGGGAWRAFVSKRARGQLGQVNLQQLAIEYREAQQQRTPEYLEAERSGQAATEVHRSQPGPAFGPPTRQLMRKQAAAMMQARARAAERGQPAQQAFELLATGTSQVEVSLVQNLEGQMRQIRRQVRAFRLRASEQRHQQLQRLFAFCKQQEPLIIEAVMSACPELLQSLSDFHLAPHRSLVCLQVNCETANHSSLVASWACGNSRHSNVFTSLKTDWSKRHSTVMSTAAAEETPTDSTSMCVKLRMCIHTTRGANALSWRNTVLSFLKENASVKDASSRSLLLDGHIVMQLSEVPVPEATGGWAKIAMSMIEEEEDEAARDPKREMQGILYLHIALQYMKPYRPTFHVLQHRSTSPTGRLECMMTHQYLSDIELAQQINLSSSWTCCLWRIVDLDVPQARLDPQRCYLQTWKPQQQPLWPRPVKGKGRRRRTAGSRKPRPAAKGAPGSQRAVADGGSTGSQQHLAS